MQHKYLTQCSLNNFFNKQYPSFRISPLAISDYLTEHTIIQILPVLATQVLTSHHTYILLQYINTSFISLEFIILLILAIMWFWTKEVTFLTEIQRKSKILKNSDSPYMNFQTVTDIMNILFPQDKISPFNTLYDQTIAADSGKALKKMRASMDLLSPQSPLGEALIAQWDTGIPLDNFRLKSDLSSCLQGNQGRLIFELKNIGGQRVIRLFDMFFLCLINCLLGQKELQRTGWDNFGKDDFLQQITLNPILGIMCAWLKHGNKQFPIYPLLLRILQKALLQVPLAMIRANLSIKVSQLHAAYLLMHYKESTQYQALAEQLGQQLEKKNKYSTKLFSAWARFSLAVVIKNTQHEYEVHQQIQNRFFNHRTPNQVLLLPPIHDKTQNKGMSFPQSLVMFQQRVRLLQWNPRKTIQWQVKQIIKSASWNPYPHFILAIYILMVLMRGKDQSQNQSYLACLSPVFHSATKIVRDEKGKQIVAAIRERFNQLRGVQLQSEVIDYSKQRKETSSRINREGGGPRISLRSYQREVSLWSQPIQSYQLYFGMQLALFLSMKIDHILGRPKFQNTQYPTTNLRFLAHYKSLLWFLALIALVIYWLK